jgi:anti-sigma factor ChrR (cupin superfamily)
MMIETTKNSQHPFFVNWKTQSAREIFPGIRVYSMWEETGKAVIVTIEPGSKWQGVDIHETSSEEIFVVEGIFNDGDRDYNAGTFIHYPVGSSHVPQSDAGCTLFVFSPS